MSDREEQLKRDIRDLQTKLAAKPVVADQSGSQIVYRPCKIQAARIAELEAIISIMERECQAL
jgi:hypothetical protein